jgi:hypothetical protein
MFIYRIVAFFGIIGVSTVALASGQMQELLQSMHNPANIATASQQLKDLATSSPAAKEELATALSTRLKDTSDIGLWRAEVQLAGDLTLSELAPALASSLDVDTRQVAHDMGGMAARMSLNSDTAAKSLVQMGTPAIPALANELNNGNRTGRYRAANALNHIGGPQVAVVFRERYATEPDPGLKKLLHRHLLQLAPDNQ